MTRPSRLSWFVLATALLAALAYSQGIGLDLMDLYQGSDLVVVGRFRNNWTWRSSGIGFGVGDIVVERVLWGSASPGETLRLDWLNFGSCSSTDYREHIGNSRIWFLSHPTTSRPTQGEPWWLRFIRHIPFTEPTNFRRVQTGGSQWVRNLEDEAEVSKLIDRPIVFLRRRHVPQTPESATRTSVVDLIARNGSSQSISVPRIQQRYGFLVGPESVSFTISDKDTDGNYSERPLPMQREPEFSITIAPGQETSTPLDLALLYPLQPECTYRVDVRAPFASDGFWRIVQTHQVSAELPKVEPQWVDTAQTWLTGR